MQSCWLRQVWPASTLQDSAAVLRVLSVLAWRVAGGRCVLDDGSGKRFFGFGKDAVARSQEVVWPTRKETIQMTAVVFGFVVVMALFLWAVDATLLTIVNKLMGRSE